MTDEEIINEARSSLVILRTMLINVCDAVGIDTDETVMSVCANEEVLKSFTIEEAINRANASIQALNKVGF